MVKYDLKFKEAILLKKFLLLIVLALMLVGCGKEEPVNKQPELDNSNNDVIAEEDMAFVEISDSSEFMDELGIKIDSTIIAEDATLSILNGAVGEISFVMTSVNGYDTICVLKMTRVDDYVSSLSGYKSSEIKDPYTVTVNTDMGNMDLECGFVEDEGVTVYTFEYNGTNFALNIGEGLSQMTIGAILDRVLEAIQ